MSRRRPNLYLIEHPKAEEVVAKQLLQLQLSNPRTPQGAYDVAPFRNFDGIIKGADQLREWEAHADPHRAPLSRWRSYRWDYDDDDLEDNWYLAGENQGEEYEEDEGEENVEDEEDEEDEEEEEDAQPTLSTVPISVGSSNIQDEIPTSMFNALRLPSPESDGDEQEDDWEYPATDEGSTAMPLRMHSASRRLFSQSIESEDDAGKCSSGCNQAGEKNGGHSLEERHEEGLRGIQEGESGKQ